jgi:hypothetical protein
MRRGQDQGFHSSLPLWRLLLSLREFGDVVPASFSVTSWRPRDSGIGSSKRADQGINRSPSSEWTLRRSLSVTRLPAIIRPAFSDLIRLPGKGAHENARSWRPRDFAISSALTFFLAHVRSRRVSASVHGRVTSPSTSARARPCGGESGAGRATGGDAVAVSWH